MKNKYSFVLAFALIIFSFAETIAQSWTKGLPPNASFQEIRNAFYQAYEKNTNIPRANENVMDGELEKFSRWEWFAQSRLDENGRPDDGSIAMKEWLKYKSEKKYQRNAAVDPANWTFVGPSVQPSNGGGAGRINTLEFDPLVPSILWIGSAGGGVWKSLDAGNSWQNKTPDLPILSIADIAIHPTNTDTVYMASGDCYGYVGSSGDFWGGIYSGGIFKSYDGGVTWDTAGLNIDQDVRRTILRLLINPSQPDILLAATNNGLYRTTNGTASWSKVSNQAFFDLEIKPGSPSTIYASDNDAVYKSTDFGATWVLLQDLTSASGRTSLAVSQANPNILYFWSEGGDFYRSTNGGNSFQIRTSPNDDFSFYGYYDNVLEVSNGDPNLIFVGGLNMVKSTDGGMTWTEITSWNSWPNADYVHADMKDIKFQPSNESTMYSCNDGGIFVSYNSGASWSDISAGLSIAQFYRISTAQTNPNIFYVGQQDNGVSRRVGNVWTKVRGGDGMNVLVDHTNSEVVYASLQYGNLALSIDGGQNFDDVSPTTGGAWITPFIMHPIDPNILFAGYDDVYKTTDGGGSWVNISSSIASGSNFTFLGIGESNTNYIYAGRPGSLHRTKDGGSTWSSITSGLPISNSHLFSDIAVSTENESKIWVTVSGYTSGAKVYASKDAGATWTNVSGTLPNIPVNAIVFQKHSKDLVYIGTDFGVYYKDSTMSDWLPFNEGLPIVNISDLEINYTSETLFAATYGRGVWSSTLQSDYDAIQEKGIKFSSLRILPNPSSGVFRIFNSDQNAFESIEIFNPMGVKVFSKSGISTQEEIHLENFPSGIYFITAKGKTNTAVSRIVLQK